MQHEHDNPDAMDEEAVQELLCDLLDQHTNDEPDLRVTTFENAGVMTLNRGLVVRAPDGGEFQVSIVRSR
jgi:hypothetical protein